MINIVDMNGFVETTGRGAGQRASAALRRTSPIKGTPAVMRVRKARSLAALAV